MSRVHERVLGISHHSPDGDEGTFSRRIHIHGSARSSLDLHLRGNGIWRSGLLFGHVRDEVLHLKYAGPGGHARWRNQAAPFEMDVRYALGWADALAVASPYPVDWVGSWIVTADRQQTDLIDALSWLRNRTDGLFDDRCILLTVGLVDHRLDAVAYRLVDEDVEMVDVVWL